MPRNDPEKPCWVWWDGAWREGFILRWVQGWDDNWRAYCEWTVEGDDGYPEGHRATLPGGLVAERVSDDPRGRGGERPPPLD